jgi:AraC-like DNA-binding protein
VEAILGHRLPVPPALRRWVAGVSVGPAGDGPVLTRLPDAATALMLRRTTAGDADLAVLGPRTRAAYFTGRDATFSLGLRIHPGRARLLLGRPATGIVDRCVSLGELWGEAGVRLAAELADLGPGPAAALRHLESTLITHLAHQPATDQARSDLAYSATQALAAADVRGTARRLHISERHLRDLFTSAVGVSPKRFARIHRIRTVLARAAHTGVAQLATEAGYYDQSHLTAEFRDLMGVPPGAYLAGRLPAVACHASHQLPV